MDNNEVFKEESQWVLPLHLIIVFTKCTQVQFTQCCFSTVSAVVI